MFFSSFHRLLPVPGVRPLFDFFFFHANLFSMLSLSRSLALVRHTNRHPLQVLYLQSRVTPQFTSIAAGGESSPVSMLLRTMTFCCRFQCSGCVVVVAVAVVLVSVSVGCVVGVVVKCRCWRCCFCCCYCLCLLCYFSYFADAISVMAAGPPSHFIVAFCSEH